MRVKTNPIGIENGINKYPKKLLTILTVTSTSLSNMLSFIKSEHFRGSVVGGQLSGGQLSGGGGGGGGQLSVGQLSGGQLSGGQLSGGGGGCNCRGVNCRGVNCRPPDKISKTYTHCLAAEKTTNHYIGQCPKWSAQRCAVFDSFYLSISEVVDDFSIFATMKYINTTGRLNPITEWED